MPKKTTLLADLYRRYAGELTAFAGRRVGRDESGDAVHDAYLRLVSYGDTDALENPRAYLYRVTANVANDYGSRSHHRVEHIDVQSEGFDLVDEAPGPADQIEQRDMLERCARALGELPEIYGHVLLLNRIDGMTQAEIATALGIPKRTVERYIAKALAHCLGQLT